MGESTDARRPLETEDKHKKMNIAIVLSLCGVMAALVFVATFLVQIFIPATGGYINFGDIMIFVSALTFGPVVGGFAGGVGSALADVLTGFASTFAPFTLVVKGFEGAIAGLISNRKSLWRDILAVIVAGLEMISGYLLAEFFPLQLRYAAFVEVPGNALQIVVGGAIGIPIALFLRRSLPEAWKK
jgi:uncharacterized membrane protein